VPRDNSFDEFTHFRFIGDVNTEAVEWGALTDS
jgi:hypothetical protein